MDARVSLDACWIHSPATLTSKAADSTSKPKRPKAGGPRRSCSSALPYRESNRALLLLVAPLITSIYSNSTCSFHVSATLQDFTSGVVAGQRGWGVDSDPIEPSHSHLAPYEPLDLALENTRRSVLPADDSSLSAPPLIPVQPLVTGPTFAEILRNVNPAYFEYQPAFTNLGLTPTTRLAELDGIEEEELRAMLEGEIAIPPLPAILVLKGLMAARGKEAGQVTETEEAAAASAKAKGADWVRLKVLEEARLSQ